jgi:hypothetical protein
MLPPRRNSLDTKLQRRRTQTILYTVVVLVVFILFATTRRTASDDEPYLPLSPSPDATANPKLARWLRPPNPHYAIDSFKRRVGKPLTPPPPSPPAPAPAKAPRGRQAPPAARKAEPKPKPKPRAVPYTDEHAKLSLGDFLREHLGPSDVKPNGRALWMSMGDEGYTRNFLSHAKLYLDDLKPRPAFPTHELVVLCLDAGCVDEAARRGMLGYGGFMHDKKRPDWARTDTWAKANGASAYAPCSSISSGSDRAVAIARRRIPYVLLRRRRLAAVGRV